MPMITATRSNSMEVPSPPTQAVHSPHGNSRRTLVLPPPKQEVVLGVPWGTPAELFTPAYWKTQAWFDELAGATPSSHRIGKTLLEEVASCLLGGYGIPAEVGLAAFRRLREDGLLREDRPAVADEIRDSLDQPLLVGGRTVRYRFAQQKSKYIAASLDVLRQAAPPVDSAISFREFFLGLSGFGLKTASWITRNWLGSDLVAILDIHVFRAGLIAGVFEPRHDLSRDYRELERKFLDFAAAISVRTSTLDALMWRDMRKAGSLPRSVVGSSA